MTDFRALLSVLTGHNVEFLIVGGFAASSHGSVRFTLDLDVVYRRTPENIQRLAAALAGIDPYLRGAPPGLPFRWDETTISRGLNFTLTTSAGALDLLGEIAGGGGYEALYPHTQEVGIFGMKCRRLTLSRLIEVKRAAGRPKDLDAIAELKALQEEEENK
jgi:hypothetical protein